MYDHREHDTNDQLSLLCDDLLFLILNDFLDMKTLLIVSQVSKYLSSQALADLIWKNLFAIHFPAYFQTADKDSSRSWYKKFKSRIEHYQNQHLALTANQKIARAAMIYNDLVALKDQNLTYKQLFAKDVDTKSLIDFAVELGNKEICDYFYSIVKNQLSTLLQYTNANPEGKYQQLEALLISSFIFHTIYLKQDWSTVKELCDKYGIKEDIHLCLNKDYIYNSKLLPQDYQLKLPFFHIAAFAGNISVMQHYIQQDPKNIEMLDINNVTGSFWAILNNQIDGVRFLLEKGASTAYKTTIPHSMLNDAALFDRSEIIQLLLQYGAANDISIRIHNRESALHIAASKGHIDCLKVLLEYDRTWLEIEDMHFGTPLMSAVASNQCNVVRYLIEVWQANVDGTTDKARVESSDTAITLAIQKDFKEVYDLLLANGAVNHINILNLFKDAALYSRLYYVKSLYESYPGKINLRGEVCNIVLYTLVAICEPDVLRYFLQNGANVGFTILINNHRDYGKSLLLIATQLTNVHLKEKEEVIKVLLEYGAKLKPNEEVNLALQSTKIRAWFELKRCIKSLKTPSFFVTSSYLFSSVSREQVLQAAKKLKRIEIRKESDVVLTEEDKKALECKPLSELRARMRN